MNLSIFETTLFSGSVIEVNIRLESHRDGSNWTGVKSEVSKCVTRKTEAHTASDHLREP